MKQLEAKEMKWYRQRLKEARRAGLSDLENAHQLVVAIESLGKALFGDERATLGRAKCCLIAFADQWEPVGEAADPTASPLPAMLTRIHKQRNDYAHEGTAARRLARQAAEVAIRLERALLNAEKKGKPMEMRDIMITPVICAEGWQTLAHVRRVMLLREFSVLPYRDEKNKWWFIEATDVVKAQFKGGTRAPSMAVRDAVENETLTPKCAKTAKAGVQVDQCKPETTLVVTDTDDAAAGLVTPFDLL